MALVRNGLEPDEVVEGLSKSVSRSGMKPSRVMGRMRKDESADLGVFKLCPCDFT